MCDSEELTCILVEQHPVLAFAMTRNAIILERGVVAHATTCAALAQDNDTLDRLLGIRAKGANKGGQDRSHQKV